MMSWVAVGAGAAFGAWLRWRLGLWLNLISPQLPLGTLFVNLGGGYLVGVAVAFFSSHLGILPEWRLFSITGFLGGLTTFSTFSIEAVLLLQRGDYLWALAHTMLHMIGSIMFCIAGFATYKAFA